MNQDLSNLNLDPSQQACLTALLADAYQAGRAFERAKSTRRAVARASVPAVLDEWVIPDLSDVEREALVQALGTS